MIFCYELTLLLMWIGICVYLFLGSRRIAYLKDQPVTIQEPSIAIIIAVRNEEDELRQALKSVCSLAYLNYRVYVINDRSTDKTADILEEMSRSSDNLTISTVQDLPRNWLGKVHALYKGYRLTDEEWLLFTDADVVFQPNALSKALSYALAQRLDHLTILPQIQSPSKWLNATLTTFRMMLEMKTRPWLISHSESKTSLGIGAFNLITREAYEKIGTHEMLRLRPDDDIQLGKAVKAAGSRQDVLYGYDEISLKWYPDVRSFIIGLQKNLFASFEYSTINSFAAALGTFLLFVLPLPLGLISANPHAIHIALSTWIVQLVYCLCRDHKFKTWWHGLTLPFAGALMVFIIVRSTFIVLKNKGIWWRDSFYPLSDLKA